MKSVLKMARVRKGVCVLGGVLGVLLFSLSLFSQGSNGRILGTVTDQTGGVISGATVTIRDKDRGVAATLTTDQAGEYNAPSLLPGTYIVSVEANGFKKLDRQNVELGVGKEVRVDLTVQPGTQTQTVTVTEAIPLVETTNATLGGTLTGTEVVDLPLNGRNYQNLMGLRPGVMLQPGGSPWTQSTNNVRPDENAWMLEGVLNANGFDARPVAGASSAITDGANILPIDAIQEFNLEENPKAEYGGKPGALVNVGIRSGTNTLHGSGYAFGRDGSWDARNVFNPAPQPVLPVQLEQFGASLGGPIKKDKLFFFANYEGLRDSIANAISTSVPELASTGHANKSMVDAIIGLQNFIAAHPGATVQTGAGTVPLSVSSLSLQLLGCPQGPLTTASTCTGGVIQGASPTSTSYLSTFPNINTSDNGIAKIDYRINNKHQINGMLYRSTYHATGEDFPMVNSAWVMEFPEVAWTATGNWIWTASSTVVNEFRTGYTRTSSCLCLQDTAAPNGTGWPINTGVTSLGGFPSVVISGFGGQLGSRRGRPMQQGPSPYLDFQDNVSYLRGKHSLKFGVEYAHIEADTDAHDTRGLINFLGGQAFSIPATSSTPAITSTALEDFFAGVPGNGSLLVGNPAVSTTSNVIGVFAQDDWRLTPKLILNLGLRWEYRSPLHELNNNVANFDPNSPTGLVQQGQASVGSTLWKSDYKNWSPRLGFAWDVTGKGTTVVRGGGSILYSMFSLAPFTGNPGITNTRNTSIATIPTGGCNVKVPIGETCTQAGGQTFGGTIQTGSAFIPSTNLTWNGVVFPTGGQVSCTAASPCSLGTVNSNLKTPYVYDWNLGITHAFTSNLSLEVQYVGTHANELITSVDLNRAAPGSGFCVNAPLTNAQLFGITYAGVTEPGACAGGPIAASKGNSTLAMREGEPYFNQFPYLQNINFVGNYAHSNYHSLQTTLIQRLSHGFNLTAGYTFGHALDNGSLNRFGAQPQDATNTAAEYASSDFDVRHRATFTASYNVPGKKGYAQLLEGWRLNTIVTVASAQPWNIYDASNNFSGTLENTDRWDFFGNPSDFKDTSSSIPFCTGFPADFLTSGGTDLAGVNCSTTSGISGITTQLPASLASACKVAPDFSTLSQSKGGCYVEGNSVMVPAKLGTFGTMGRNIFRDAGFKDVDFSIFKNFTFKERFTAQFRVELFNLFNHPVISNPFGSVNGGGAGFDPSGNSTFGCGCLTPDNAAGNPIVGSGDAREMQLGLKLTF